MSNLLSIFTTCLTACFFFCPSRLCCDDVAMFPDLSSFFGEYNFIIANTNDGKNFKNNKKPHQLGGAQTLQLWKI